MHLKLIVLMTSLKDLKKRLENMAKAAKGRTIIINGVSSNIRKESQGTKRIEDLAKTQRKNSRRKRSKEVMRY